jgi:3-oxoacyl-[acyl-carrier-protein] synthase III
MTHEVSKTTLMPKENTEMSNSCDPIPVDQEALSFYDRPNVHKELIPIGQGVPFGLERVDNPSLGIGGVYGTWGESFDNTALQDLINNRLGMSIKDEDKMDLAQLGFVNRCINPALSDSETIELELEVGARMLREAASTNGWNMGEIEGVLIGTSVPVVEDYVEEIAGRAGIPEDALKVSVHKACDSSVGALNLALNPELAGPGQTNIAKKLFGKKVLVGGVEGLSRFYTRTRDLNAIQLFGNGAGVFGFIPGKTMRFLVGKNFEAYDEEGVLAVHMYYPHSGKHVPGQSSIEVSQETQSHIRVAGLMNEPLDGTPIAMEGLIGMVKLFVRNGARAVNEVYQAYQKMMEKLDLPDKSLAVAIVHHANLKIVQLLEKNLNKEGIHIPMPWLVKDFGNVSAASNMIAFLRRLPFLKPGDHVLFDGFGAGTYYDVLAVAVGGG